MYFMPKINVQFRTTPYGDKDDFMLLKIETRDYGNGLPPTHSQCILMNKSEIEDLIECLLKTK
jgi:hypothetical protein